MNIAVYTVVSVVFLLVFIWVGVIDNQLSIEWMMSSVVVATFWPLALITMITMLWGTKQ